MCNNCGHSPCGCTNNTPYQYNWYTVPSQPCNPCTTTEVCKKVIPSQCIGYDGVNLSNLNIVAPSNLKAIVQKIDTEIGTLKTQNALDAATKAAILAALNNINTRLNLLEPGVDQPPYVI